MVFMPPGCAGTDTPRPPGGENPEIPRALERSANRGRGGLRGPHGYFRARNEMTFLFLKIEMGRLDIALIRRVYNT